jgi:hypothetical protein
MLLVYATRREEKKSIKWTSLALAESLFDALLVLVEDFLSLDLLSGC